MAYFDQARKAVMAPKIKAIAKKYGVTCRLGVQHHSGVVLNISAGKIDFFKSFNDTNREQPRYLAEGWTDKKDSLQVNTSWYHEAFSGKALDFLKEVIDVMHTGNHDNSDAQSDYFDVGWYVYVNIGKWDKPYQLIK